MNTNLVSKLAVCAGFALMALTSGASDVVPSTVTLYQTTTWTKPVTHAVVRQRGHAQFFGCGTAQNVVFTGNAADPAQILAFFNANCTSEIGNNSYSNDVNTGFSKKVYLPVGSSQPTHLVVSSSWLTSQNGSPLSTGLQLFTIELEDAANPASGTVQQQGVNTQFQGSDNPVINNYKETLAYVGSSPIEWKAITN